ncbi:hypothetical protein Tco_1082836 [Tanacetum coccineum]|uniref:Uncharacterized protein n=1 Tax=Tanacetum coccineum TaxID=301880 RepID=A0ABQ5I1I8_9ASTR
MYACLSCLVGLLLLVKQLKFLPISSFFNPRPLDLNLNEGCIRKTHVLSDLLSCMCASAALLECTGSRGAIGSCHREKSKENGVWHQIWYGTRIQWSGAHSGALNEDILKNYYSEDSIRRIHQGRYGVLRKKSRLTLKNDIHHSEKKSLH